jgi:hypothetical protein
MGHDATKTLLGASLSSGKDVSDHAADPATFLAGLAVSMGSDGLISLLHSAGMRIGISLGRSLSDTKKTSVIRTGYRVPIRASLKRSSCVITVTNVANLVSGTDDSVTVGATIFTAQAGAATPGDATFQASGATSATATSLATQINAHATASTLVYAVASSATVTLYAKVEGAGSGHDVAVAYTDNDANVGITIAGLAAGKLDGGSDTISDIAYVAIGAKVYVNRVTGKADIAMTNYSTITDAVYLATELSGIDEDGNTVAAALIDMPGGL